MHDCPYTADRDPQYLSNIVEPLEKGEGVACFVVDDGDGDRMVLYCSHKLTGQASRSRPTSATTCAPPRPSRSSARPAARPRRPASAP